MTGSAEPLPRLATIDLAPRPLWRRPAIRAILLQALLLLAILHLAWSIAANVRANLPHSNLGFGLDFLTLPTRFEIGENYLNATARDPVWMTFLVGLLNTLRVSILGILLCTVLGLLVALARLSANWLASRVALLYVEAVRNVPLLLQMLFWYGFSTLLPLPRQAWAPIEGVFVTNRGIYLPALRPTAIHLLAAAVFLGACVAAAWLIHRGRLHRERTGCSSRAGPVALALTLLLPAAILLAGGAGLEFDYPELKGFNFRGGTSVSPEFVAVLVSLSVYQSGFAAETIRAGILGVPKGQIEAARSLGLPPRLVLSRVVLPQAMRIVVPPMASQYMSLTKNSSLAVVIGYPELVRVSTAVISETGRAIECVAILMSTYLALSLLTAAFMNWYNRRVAFVDA